jgi:putative integral membrane protein (TIGR02587 family)
MAIAHATESTFRDHIRPLVRGLCGGFLFSVPIIYTMEMWWLGYGTDLAKIAALLLFSFVLSVGLNMVSGFREGQGLVECMTDAVEALALGIVVSATMLCLLGEIDAGAAWPIVARQVVVLAIPISIGVSMARSLLGEQGDDEAEAEAEAQADAGVSASAASGGLREDAKDLALTAFGGVFLGLSVAPTEEILIIATHSQLPQTLGTVALALALSYLTLFEAQFVGQSQRLRSEGMFQDPWQETVLTYAVSLVISTGLLWFLGFLNTPMAWDEILSMIVVLALPVSMGGAAARLIL